MTRKTLIIYKLIIVNNMHFRTKQMSYATLYQTNYRKQSALV